MDNKVAMHNFSEMKKKSCGVRKHNTDMFFFFQTKEEIKMVGKRERDRLTLPGHG